LDGQGLFSAFSSQSQITEDEKKSINGEFFLILQMLGVSIQLFVRVWVMKIVGGMV